MKEELYSDGVGEITVTGSIVRIDLVSLSATERDEKNAPKAVLRQRVIMPADAFASAVDLMQSVVRGLSEAGTIQRPAAATAMPVATATADARMPNASPNFN